MERTLPIFFFAGAAVLALTSTGCEQALFPPNMPRSQYERFTYQREGFTPMEQEEAFGATEIDLRARLKPMSER